MKLELGNRINVYLSPGVNLEMSRSSVYRVVGDGSVTLSKYFNISVILQAQQRSMQDARRRRSS